MATQREKGGFAISSAPLADPGVDTSAEAEEEESPIPGKEPLLFALARNPETLFLCWSVDWSTAFGSVPPADRTVHIKLKGQGREQTRSVEPLSGSCSLGGLEPGASYAAELGYYGPNASWRSIASASEVTLPVFFPSGDEMVEVATIPFHLSFERMMEVFGATEGDDIAQMLARWQERVARGELRGGQTIMRSLDLSAEELADSARRKEVITGITPGPRRTRSFAGSSPPANN